MPPIQQQDIEENKEEFIHTHHMEDYFTNKKTLESVDIMATRQSKDDQVVLMSKNETTKKDNNKELFNSELQEEFPMESKYETNDQMAFKNFFANIMDKNESSRSVNKKGSRRSLKKEGTRLLERGMSNVSNSVKDDADNRSRKSVNKDKYSQKNKMIIGSEHSIKRD